MSSFHFFHFFFRELTRFRHNVLIVRMHHIAFRCTFLEVRSPEELEDF
jgi:hypothetical protein